VVNDLHICALCMVYGSDDESRVNWEWAWGINAITVKSDWRKRWRSRRNACILRSSILRIKTRAVRGTGCDNQRRELAMLSETPMEAEWTPPDKCRKQCSSLPSFGNISGLSDLWFINLTKRWTVIISFSGNTPVHTGVCFLHIYITSITAAGRTRDS